MSATITDINQRRLSDTEKLVAASLQIIRLETTVTMLEMSLVGAITKLKLTGEIDSARVLEESLKRALAFCGAVS